MLYPEAGMLLWGKTFIQKIYGTTAEAVKLLVLLEPSVLLQISFQRWTCKKKIVEFHWECFVCISMCESVTCNYISYPFYHPYGSTSHWVRFSEQKGLSCIWVCCCRDHDELSLCERQLLERNNTRKRLRFPNEHGSLIKNSSQAFLWMNSYEP